jgi:hypothetical protein
VERTLQTKGMNNPSALAGRISPANYALSMTHSPLSVSKGKKFFLTDDGECIMGNG